jgi:hypothetical protein
MEKMSFSGYFYVNKLGNPLFVVPFLCTPGSKGHIWLQAL